MPKSFPSAAVAEAYARPRVDASRAKITHGRPDLELLRKFCYSKFGWSKVRAAPVKLPDSNSVTHGRPDMELLPTVIHKFRSAKPTCELSLSTIFTVGCHKTALQTDFLKYSDHNRRRRTSCWSPCCGRTTSGRGRRGWTTSWPFPSASPRSSPSGCRYMFVSCSAGRRAGQAIEHPELCCWHFCNALLQLF